MATENGDEKLIALARHIAKTLGHNELMAGDILQIFSNFDGRFSGEKLSDQINHVPVVGDLDPRTFAALDRTFSSIERQISRSLAIDHPIWSDSADSSAFLDCVDELLSTAAQWSPLAADKNFGSFISRAEEVTDRVMFRLAKEFKLLMERGRDRFQIAGNLSVDSDEEEDKSEEENYDEDRIPVAEPLTDYDVVIDALPSGTVSDLREIAKRMISAGYGRDCSHAYAISRREFLEESVSRLGLEKLSNEEIQRMTWQEVEECIEKWIKASNVVLRILFPSERQLCDRVFLGSGAAADLSFMEVCRVLAVRVLNFADAVAIGSRAPERLFKVLDLYETVRDLIPEFEANFDNQYSVFLRNEAVAVWKRLGEVVRGIFMELEKSIQQDPAKSMDPRGGLHPITRYVMNYLRAACWSRETLEQVFEEGEVAWAGAGGSLSVQMDWIMEELESNLEMKSKTYGDPSLRTVFMMNNRRYIVQKVKDSELGLLLGEDWIRKHNAKVKQLLSSYLKSSWNKVLNVLKVENSGSVDANAVPKHLSMKEKITLFTTQFNDICKSQSQWLIFDEQLRNEVRVSVANLLLPAYSNFIGRFRSAADVGKQAARYNYGVEDVEIKISELFQGGNQSTGGRK